jgi:uncharacterized GH25 family protein
MRMSKILFLVCILLGATQVNGQEFWISTVHYFSQVGDTAVLSWVSGQNVMSSPFEIKKDDVSLQIYNKQGVVNGSAFVRGGDKSQIRIPLKDEGTHVVASQLTIPRKPYTSEEFLTYAEAYGQDETIYYLDSKRSMGLPLHELLTQYVKVFIQAGNARDNTYQTIVGTPMEIIPERNPTQLKVGDSMRVKVLVRGKPKLGVRVKVWNRVSGRSTLQNIYTLADGCIEFKISSKGVWVIDSLITEPALEPGVDFETQHSAIVFGVK